MLFLLVPLCNILNSGIVIPPALLFLFSTRLSIHGLLYFHMNFRVEFSLCEEWPWNFDGDCIEHTDGFV
jgi:hypothetical protein